MLVAAKEFSGSHLLGTEASICHSQIDIVAYCKEQDSQYGCQQDVQACLITFQHASTIILRSKHNIRQWCYVELVCSFLAPQHIVF